MPRTCLHIIGIEQDSEAIVSRSIAGQRRLQDEFFEKPGGVRQVPFRRAGIFHGLQPHVLRRERCGERKCLCPDLIEQVRNVGTRCFLHPLIQQSHIYSSTREPAAVPPAEPVSATKRSLDRQRTRHSNAGIRTHPVHKCAIKAVGCVVLIKKNIVSVIHHLMGGCL